MADDHEIERRISTESRLTRLESEVNQIKTDVLDTKSLVNRIASAVDNLALEIRGAKASFGTFTKTVTVIGTILVTLVSAGYVLHYITPPEPSIALVHK